MDKLPEKIVIKINGEAKNDSEGGSLSQTPEKEIAAGKAEAPATDGRKTRKMPPAIWRNSYRPKRKTGTGGRKNAPYPAFAAVGAAVAAGILIGFFLLNLMLKEEQPNRENAAAPKEPAAEAAETAELPEMAFYIFQAGYFKNEDSLNKMVEDLKGKNLSAKTVKDADHYRVFIGVADSLERGKEMRKSLSLYSETWPAEVKAGEKRIARLTREEKIFLEKAPEIYKRLVEKAVSRYMNSPSAVSDAEILRDMEEIRAMELKNEKVLRLRNALVNAYQQWEGFEKAGKEEAWRNIQENLTDFVEAYFHLS